MKINRFLACISVALLTGFLNSCGNSDHEPLSPTDYVNPFIGTGDHGHVFLGANSPFGFVQLGPTQHNRGWDWCSGYHYSDSIIVGFSHQHLSGTGIGDLGDITFFPFINELREAKFSHESEKAGPGFYSVILTEPNITVDLIATPRTGLHRYRYPASDTTGLIIDLAHGIGWDSPVEGYMIKENDSVVSGYRASSGWANKQKVYFTATFSRPIKEFIVSDENGESLSDSIRSRRAYGKLLFSSLQNQPLLVKVGLSPVSIDNAKNNLKVELPGWDLDEALTDIDNKWNSQLDKIKIQTNSEAVKSIFYTALYHTMVAPSVFSDCNGDYVGTDGKIHRHAGFTNYTTFSLWDTYRAAHPLATIIHPEMMTDYTKTMLAIYKQQGKLPVWHLVGNETDCMVGNPGIPVLADIVLKGFDVNAEAAFEAMKTSAMLDERSLGLLKEYGYIPYDKEPANETVAKGLEYALADWCVAQVADKLDKPEQYRYFLNRSRSYQKYFDTKTQFMRGVSSEGEFREPFNPFHTVHRADDYTEGNAWQYTWLVPHDVYGLIDLFGGEQPFVNKLDSLFIVEGDMGEDASPDITGLIGQYAHGNEPSHHVVYLYPYVGQQWKTAEKVREILDTMYFNAPAGLCGNEDVGQMSAWYIMSALGFYQVIPAGGIYVFGSPLVDKAELRVGKDKTFTIIAHNNNDENIYIQRVSLNGVPYTKSYIRHTDIAAGGVLEFEMGPEPSKSFGVATADRPPRL